MPNITKTRQTKKSFLEVLSMCEKAEKERLLEHLEKAIYRIDKIQKQCNKFDSIAQALDNEDTQLVIAKCFVYYMKK